MSSPLISPSAMAAFHCGDSSSDEGDVPLLWVLKATLDEVSTTVEKGDNVSKEKIDELIDPDEVADDAVLIPLDMSEAAIADLDDLVSQRGATEVAKLLVHARKLFVSNLEAMSEEDRASVPQELSGADYKQMMEEEMAEAAAAAEEGEEEELGSADEAVEEEADEEPATKKQKTECASACAKKQKTD